MRFRINLASQPYENARRFFAQWGAALVVLFLVSALLVVAAARTWRGNHALARSISEERDRLDKLNAQEKADLAILNKDQNRDVRERAAALNGLITRKSFSWTRIFNDLEKMMPSRLHVVSITPQLTNSDQIQIRMMVGGDSRDKAIELVQNMEKAPDFHAAQIISENSATKDKGQQGDLVTFEISAEYVPAAANAMSEAEKNASAESEEKSDSSTPQTTVTGAKPKSQRPKPATGGRP
jgi:hypothetical protein